MQNFLSDPRIDTLHASTTFFIKVTKVINHEKNSPLKCRLFPKLCEDKEATYTSLLYYCKVRCLSREKFIQQVFELKEEIEIFLIKITDNVQICLGMIILLLDCLFGRYFGELSVLNKLMQGRQMHALIQTDKATPFIYLNVY